LQIGYVVNEKSRIPEMVYDKLTKIHRIILNPSNCRPAPGVIDAIKNADCIIIGPGSLYTNVIPNLLVNGVTKAIKESTAIKAYISNIMTEPGQTDEYTVSDHLNAIIDHCGIGVVDYCIYDVGEIVPEFIKKYNLEGQDLVEQDIEKVKGIKFLAKNLAMVSNEFIRHDANLVVSSIIELICDDLKYQDKQNDPQYIMLNTKLREEKRISKIKKSMKKKELKGETLKNSKNTNIKKSKSRFSNKYSERMASIKESDEKAKLKMQKEERRKKEEEKKLKKESKKKEVITKNKRETKEKELEKVSKPKSARGRKKTPQEIREELLENLKKTEE